VKNLQYKDLSDFVQWMTTLSASELKADIITLRNTFNSFREEEGEEAESSQLDNSKEEEEH
jgi:hypothetical protein